MTSANSARSLHGFAASSGEREVEKRSDRCERCRYWDEAHITSNGALCRRHAPRPFPFMSWWLGEFEQDESGEWKVPRYQHELSPEPYESAFAAWQYTDANDWCGEFVERVEPILST